MCGLSPLLWESVLLPPQWVLFCFHLLCIGGLFPAGLGEGKSSVVTDVDVGEDGDVTWPVSYAHPQNCTHHNCYAQDKVYFDVMTALMPLHTQLQRRAGL